MAKSNYKLPYYGDEIKQLFQKIENLSKSDIGLDKVDNTSDMDKPISIAMQTAINELNTAIDNALNTAKTYTDTEIARFDFIKVVSGLPETGLENKIYLVAKSESESSDIFDEYIWINSNWEYIGTKQIEVDLSDKLSSVVRVWQPNTYYEVGDIVIFDDIYAYDILRCKITHTSGDELVFDYWECTTYFRRANNAGDADYATDAAYATQAYNYAEGGVLEEVILDLQESKSDKTEIQNWYPDNNFPATYSFSEVYNQDIRYPEYQSGIEFWFKDGEYEQDYHAGLTFSTGDTPPQISYTNSGILNWVGIDCATSNGYSIFQPSANTHYDIVFYFNGTHFIGLVNGFVPATGNVVSE